jgi:DNA-binding XRE family transcriptional regulator
MLTTYFLSCIIITNELKKYVDGGELMNKRLNLIAARISAGFTKQEDFVKELQRIGVDITGTKYSNIENGVAKTIDIFLALDIADFLKQKPRDIFLLISTKKISRNNAKAS